MDIISILEVIENSGWYMAALAFFAWYPIFSSIMWMFTSVIYFFRREKGDQGDFYSMERHPPVSVIIPAYNEARNIGEVLENVSRIDYPDFEVLVVDDASTDRTAEIVERFAGEGKARLIRKKHNQGKAMALNDAIPCSRGEILLIIDADASPEPDILKYMIPHFRYPRVAGVTGNPRVYNRGTLLGKLQAIEFSSIISIQRRAQRIWGRLMTMSGVVGAFRRSALYHVGLYSPEMATEDIDITWKLQMKHYDVRYEARSVVWMRVPRSLKGLWRQRRRWALGQGQVIGRYGPAAMDWRHRRLWPILTEAIISILWSYDFVFLTALWITSYTMGIPPVGASPIPNWWGMLISSVCLMQLLTGVILDRRYDRGLGWYYGAAVFYPIIYWILLAVVTACFS
ncbi:MAG: poly-beta-1,6 N-acetyl-D-glucosamine synthase, partial [Candidatus Latescibacteria bacterium]|nr:poly-beta-1,6 N-acetyl-D-glucosamine synthase [bacterium]MBD3423795.1 poly-beta-1,6 N-acetyl-D-glucosamine synthase [Candidatus Latescibacterota bacterium]